MNSKLIGLAGALFVSCSPGSAVEDHSNIVESLGGVQIECPAQIKAIAMEGVQCAVTGQTPIQISKTFNPNTYAIQMYSLKIARVLYSLPLPKNYSAKGELVAWVKGDASITGRCEPAFFKTSAPLCRPHQDPFTLR